MDDDGKQISRKRTNINLAQATENDLNVTEELASNSSVVNGFVPFSSSNSETTGFSFYNPRFQNDYESDGERSENELNTDDTNEENKPIYLMFPSLRKANLNNRESTTYVTKLLVGQKADFSMLNPINKKFIVDSNLQPVPECLNENETMENVFNLGDITGNVISEPATASQSNKNGQKVDTKRKKKLRKVMDNKKDLCSSSESGINLPPKSPKNKRRAPVKKSSSEDYFADDEQDS